MYLGLIRFSLDREAFPDDGQVISSELKKLGKKLRRDFDLVAKPDPENLAILVCILKNQPQQIREMVAEVAGFLENAGAGRVDDSVLYIEHADRLLSD